MRFCRAASKNRIQINFFLHYFFFNKEKVKKFAGIVQLVERLLAKQKVEGSNPFSRSTAYKTTDIGGFFVPCHSSPRDLFSSTFWKWLYLLARSPDFLSRSTAYKTTGMGGFFICFQLLICYYDCGYPSS